MSIFSDYLVRSLAAVINYTNINANTRLLDHKKIRPLFLALFKESYLFGLSFDQLILSSKPPDGKHKLDSSNMTNALKQVLSVNF